MLNEPLSLPRGSVRALLSLLVVGAFIASSFFETSGEAQVALSGLAGVIITHYFKQRENADKEL